MLPLNQAIQSAIFCSVREILLDLFVDVARDARLQQLVGLARHVAHRREQAHRGFGRLLEEQQQIVAVELEQFACRRARRAVAVRGAAVEQRQLAEQSRRRRAIVEHDLLAGGVLDEQLDFAAC